MAQTLHAYPTKALRFVLPFPPGGATDALGRTVAELLQLGLKQNIIPDYKPGAGGNVGYALLSRAPADGYTI
ncbi:MAG: tripartite tricarboxylate transporter substrate-binding protein, partial [Betaproteobacteria bacterium]